MVGDAIVGLPSCRCNTLQSETTNQMNASSYIHLAKATGSCLTVTWYKWLSTSRLESTHMELPEGKITDHALTWLGSFWMNNYSGQIRDPCAGTLGGRRISDTFLHTRGIGKPKKSISAISFHFAPAIVVCHQQTQSTVKSLHRSPHPCNHPSFISRVIGSIATQNF